MFRASKLKTTREFRNDGSRLVAQSVPDPNHPVAGVENGQPHTMDADPFLISYGITTLELSHGFLDAFRRFVFSSPKECLGSQDGCTPFPSLILRHR